MPRGKLFWITISLCLVMIYFYFKEICDFFDENFNLNNYAEKNANYLKIVRLEFKFHNYEKGILKFDNKNIWILLHGKNDLISREIMNHHIWDIDLITQLILFFKNHKHAILIDIGCNLGVYTLIAAAYGHQVIAIDAYVNNTDRLMQSVIANHFEFIVTILLNVVSNVKKQFSMSINSEDIGSQQIIPSKRHKYKVNSIFLNDLVPIIITNDVEIIIKIDINGGEIDAFKESSKLLKETNVIAIIIEWKIIRKHKDCQVFVAFLIEKGYKPYKNFFSLKMMDYQRYELWETEVVWMKH